jgi:hypothetical protein
MSKNHDHRANALRNLRDDADQRAGAVKAAMKYLYETLGSYGCIFLEEQLSSDEVESAVSAATSGVPIYEYGVGASFFSRFEKELEKIRLKRLNPSGFRDGDGEVKSPRRKIKQMESPEPDTRQAPLRLEESQCVKYLSRSRAWQHFRVQRLRNFTGQERRPNPSPHPSRA